MKSRAPSKRGVAKSGSDAAQTIRDIYSKLSSSWGPQHWWPAKTPFEVIVGTILTQNTSWTNVERAMTNLRKSDKLSLDAIREIEIGELEQLVRPSGYFRQKAKRLKEFVAFVDAHYAGSLGAMLATPTTQLRKELLELKGIGSETADSILLYAGHHAIFVVDAYTRRVLERHEVIIATEEYDEVRMVVEEALTKANASVTDTSVLLDPRRPEVHPPSTMSQAAKTELAQKYNEMHGLFVQLGKHYCSKQNPKCEICPLGPMLKPQKLRKTRV